ncbi:endo-polygalacturonase [Prosthecobacter fluviatilis]|uniref:Endo-polygalacturonase n=1 Tax=Prosthecobacter fluviatilis TaxID=445931 RepID=A0ABW0KYK4_9BACT
MKFIALTALLLAPFFLLHAGDDLVVYPPVPGLAASEHYRVRVRAVGGEWKSAFVWQTECKTEEAYFDTLAGWTHSYVNFETSGAVEVEISRANGQPIRSAAVHPERNASACAVKEGRALVKLDRPCLVAVDIDGQMDGQDTGKGYEGPPIHTVSVFANPPLADKPSPDGPGVRTVKPGEKPPAEGGWSTLYFLPGVHDIGAAFPVHASRRYYIPGDAMVYGTFCNPEWKDGHNIRIFGHGTLSGARIKHESALGLFSLGQKNISRKPVEIFGAEDTQVEGITVADSASHSVMLINRYTEGHPNKVQWTKIFTWRANGDGINPFGNTLIEDCFIRTQDDSLYVNGRGIRRCVLWNDANGSSFVLSSIPERRLMVEDCDVIYSRAKWHRWSGGRVFNARGENDEAGGPGVVFRNIRITDPRPTLQQFFICLNVPKPYGDGGHSKGDISGVLFQNISIAAPSVLGEPQMLWGQKNARIRDLTFENLTVGGKPVTSAEFFKTNEFVEGLRFAPSASSKK